LCPSRFTSGARCRAGAGLTSSPGQTSTCSGCGPGTRGCDTPTTRSTSPHHGCCRARAACPFAVSRTLVPVCCLRWCRVGAPRSSCSRRCRHRAVRRSR
jgi:hypothetical protein